MPSARLDDFVVCNFAYFVVCICFVYVGLCVHSALANINKSKVRLYYSAL